MYFWIVGMALVMPRIEHPVCHAKYPDFSEDQAFLDACLARLCAHQVQRLRRGEWMRHQRKSTLRGACFLDRTVLVSSLERHHDHGNRREAHETLGNASEDEV